MSETIRAVSEDGFVKISVVESREIVEKARAIHGLSPTATAALGRSLSATSLLGDMLKEEKASLTVRINGGGTVGTLMTVSDSSGNVRGYAQNAEADLPTRADGKLDVGGLVGKNGMITVSRDFGYGEPYVGSTALVSGEIAEDYTAYYTESEQVPAACGLGVLVDVDKTVKAAGGFIVQLLPGAPDGHIEKLESNILSMPQVTKILDETDVDALIEKVMSGFNPQILERRKVEYSCNCTRERVSRALMGVGLETLLEMAESPENTRIHCQFCDVEYLFSNEEIMNLTKK